MKPKSMSRSLMAVLGVALTAVCAFAESPARPNTVGIAKKLVTESANIKQKEVVFVEGGVADLDLLDAIAIEVEKAGAVPVVSFSTESRMRRTYEDVPAQNDALVAQAALKLVDVQTTNINIDFVENPAYLAGIPPARMASRNKAFEPVGQAALKRNIKSVNLGNGLYPTAALAQRFGIAKEELARIFWSGVNVDYGTMQAMGQALSRALGSGKEVRLTNPNGTDIRMRIEGRPNFASDGVISDEDVKRGGPACLVWLPAGEVYLAPLPGTAEGTVVIDRSHFQDTEILGLTLKVKGGKITSMTAKSGLEAFKPHYDAAGPGKDEFAFFDIGINPNVHAPANSQFLSYVQEGMVTVGIGGNTWAGGTNSVAFGHHGFLAGSTLEVDGKALVQKGALVPEIKSASR